MALKNDKKRILLVEDNEDIAALLAKLLEIYGYDTVIAFSAQQVDDAVGTYAFKLAIVDILLGEEDGRDIAKSLKEANPSLPVFFMSGVPKSEIGREYLDRVDGVLEKPFSPSQLKALLDERLPAGAGDAKDSLGMVASLMASVASEQEEIRRQQARLSTFFTVFQNAKTGEVKIEEIQEFKENTRRFEEGLERIKTSMEEAQRILRGLDKNIRDGKG